MEYTEEELIEAKRQIDSTIHKLRAVVNTLVAKENLQRHKSQITLVKRRIKAFEIALLAIYANLCAFLFVIR